MNLFSQIWKGTSQVEHYGYFIVTQKKRKFSQFYNENTGKFLFADSNNTSILVEIESLCIHIKSDIYMQNHKSDFMSKYFHFLDLNLSSE